MAMNTSLFLIHVILTSYSAMAICSYDFAGGNDVIILLDNSGSISDRNIHDVKDYLRLLIRRRMLIGPEIDRTRLTFMNFYTHSFRVTDLDYISRPAPVYESEFLAPGGVFDVIMRRTQESPDIDGTDPGFVRAIAACTRLFAKNDAGSRRKIVILITDFHFDGANKGKDVLQVLEEMVTLRRNVASLGESLEVYGVGIGGYFNRTNMASILAAGNRGSGASCGKTIAEWWSYLQQAGTLPVKDTYGPRRKFSDPRLCCTLCAEQNPKTMYAECSLEEFRSDFTWDDLRVPARVPLECTTSGRVDQCKDRSTRIPWSTERPEGPEGPEGPDEPEEPFYPNVPGSPGHDNGEGREKTATSNSRISALAVVFALVNLFLIITFILVCVYAHKLEAPAKYRNKQKQRALKKPAQGSDQLSLTSSQTLKPTRKAPLPPGLETGCNSPGGADDSQSQKSSAYLVSSTASSAEMDDQIYTNQWVSEELEANKRRAENQNKRLSYLSLFREDAATKLGRFRRWAGSVKSQIVDSGRNYVNQDVIQELHDSHQQDGSSVGNVNNKWNANSNQQNANKQWTANSHLNEGTGQEESTNLSDELKERLKILRMKAERY